MVLVMVKVMVLVTVKSQTKEQQLLSSNDYDAICSKLSFLRRDSCYSVTGAQASVL